ncbi:2,3-dihydroxybenzoate-AMP ligase [Pilimelia anulata]|uniref:2,3-dihydroxybenzoate-AMP ligase n=1 Tax=Pilimelia anulata TaxID=53371 RepID=A0A8J3B7Q9_9ACTN|nr:class I adenylate-forming enzyme family protein [Pilimelia anulata]GGJ83034.1 2,3-dihydroxybenzoate-AMP ligase [Pilimelia anulata]
MTVLPTRDLVPAALRRWWSAAGPYPGADLFTLFDRHAAAHPQRAAVIDDDGALTYAALRERALRLAGGLRAAGVRPGEVVAIQLPNGWRAVAADLAVAALGAVALPYPIGRGRRDTRALLGRSRAAAAVVPDKYGDTSPARVLRALAPELPDLRAVVVAGGGPGSLEALAADAAPVEPVPADPAGPARILVSSGSEAAPKMIAYSHDALAGGRGAFIAGLHHGAEPMRNLFLVPLASSFGSSGTAVTLARHGGTLIVQGRFDPVRALDLIDGARPHLVFGVPTMFAMMLAEPRLDSIDTSSLRAIVAGGSRVDPATVDGCRERFGAAYVNCYGSADGVNCTTDPADPPADVHTAVGRPNPAVAAIRVVGEDGRDVPAGGVGEIWGLGPMSPLCYVDPAFDARYRTAGGWVRTGDLGRFDAAGYLHVVGRKHEVVIRGGRNLSPVEVELLLAQHPDVTQVACLGVPDPLMGERMAACVALRPGTALTLAAAAEYLTDAHGLERAKLPEVWRVFDRLPLSAAGKIDKRGLWEALAAGAAG